MWKILRNIAHNGQHGGDIHCNICDCYSNKNIILAFQSGAEDKQIILKVSQ